MDFKYGIITVSDSCFAGEANDKSGPTIRILLQEYYNAVSIVQTVVPDDEKKIEEALLNFSDKLGMNCIITTGGTGCSSRDVTPEATKKVIERDFQQLSMAMLIHSLKYTKFAALTRGVCGIRGKTLIINFPGSNKACGECFEAIQEILPHTLELLNEDKAATKEVHEKIQQEEKKKETPKPQKKTKIQNFSELLAQSASKMDDAILGDKKETPKQQESSLKTTEKPTRENNLKSLDPVGIEKKKSATKIVSSHDCPHKQSDRTSKYPMIEVNDALELIYDKVTQISKPVMFRSPMDCPPFNASLKDGYAMKTVTLSSVFNVIGCISAGDSKIMTDFQAHECYKINTGAAVPEFADCIVQIEDTELVSADSSGNEKEIRVLKTPTTGQDIRLVGADLVKDQVLFTSYGTMGVAEKTLLASVGLMSHQKMPKIAIISTGDELVEPSFGELPDGKIYDSNTTMLKLLCQKYGFEVKFSRIAKDDKKSLKTVMEAAMNDCQVIISSGGVSMGDKDFVKPLLMEMNYQIHFGRVNVKPGKPMTFATNSTGTAFFGLPGNPVSAFVTFSIFVLPALRFICGFSKVKSTLPVINVMLIDAKYKLDERPEYVRATLTFDAKNGQFCAATTADQLSSRVASLIDADVLLHLPEKKDVNNGIIAKGRKLKATVLDQFFLSRIIE